MARWMAQPSRRGRALLLLACLAVSHVAKPWLKPTTIPAIVAQQPKPMEFLQTIETNAVTYCQSKQLAGREDFLNCMRRLFTKPGLSLVVGGSNVGKTTIIQQLLSGLNDSSPVLYVNMRLPDSDDVFVRLGNEAVLERSGWMRKTFGLDVERWSNIMDATAKATTLPSWLPSSLGLLPSLTTFYKEVKLSPTGTIAKMIETAKKRAVVPVFVIDEANLALPNEGSKEAKAFMSFAVSVSKEKGGQAAVILISSEYGYPYRLEAAGVNMGVLQKVILAPEVDGNTMIQVLRDEWGMPQELAEAFEEHFGGHLFLCQQAVTRLIDLFALDQGDSFDPYGMLDNADLPGLVENSATRMHMENIADKGWSAITETNKEGAREITKRNYGAVIGRMSTAFDIPPEDKAQMFTSGDDRQVLVSPSKHMRKCIQQVVAIQRTKEAAKPWEALRWPWE